MRGQRGQQKCGELGDTPRPKVLMTMANMGRGGRVRIAPKVEVTARLLTCPTTILGQRHPAPCHRDEPRNEATSIIVAQALQNCSSQDCIRPDRTRQTPIRPPQKGVQRTNLGHFDRAESRQ